MPNISLLLSLLVFSAIFCLQSDSGYNRHETNPTIKLAYLKFNNVVNVTRCRCHTKSRRKSCKCEKMFNIQRRQSALIMIGFVLVAGQCYFVLHKHNIRQLAVVKMFLTPPPKNSKFNDEPISNIPAKMDSRSEILTSISTGERYELMEKYAKDALPDTDPPFKRILFWNEVTHYHPLNR